jgi:preprotein translocase subunit YajC
MDAFGMATLFALIVMFVASLFISFHYRNERRRRKHLSMLNQLERQAWRRHRL